MFIYSKQNRSDHKLIIISLFIVTETAGEKKDENWFLSKKWSMVKNLKPDFVVLI